MARIARVVAPGGAHHVTQRGNRRQQTFFCDNDYRAYLELIAQWCSRCAVEIWAYCLMPNHVHLVAVPESEDGLRRAIGEAHRRYTRLINFREGWRGHLWQGRFASYVMSERYLLAAVRYIEMNPVRAELVDRLEEYPWSNAAAHTLGREDILVKVSPVVELVDDWGRFITGQIGEQEVRLLRRHERTGRPLGGESFIDGLERALSRRLRKQKPGPKPKKRTK